MFALPSASRQALPHAPIFPPLPLDDTPGAPTSGPAPLYCPHRVPRTAWRTADGLWMAGGQSIGHGPGAGGNEGTAEDRGTGAKGSNLTRSDGGPSGDDIKGPGNSGPDGGPIRNDKDDPLLGGTQGGAAQPRRPS